MELNSFDLKLNDLPAEVEVSIPTDMSEKDFRQMLEDLKAQVSYNSRFEEDVPRQPSVQVIKRAEKTVRLKVF
jgi:hypothetical protein